MSAFSQWDAGNKISLCLNPYAAGGEFGQYGMIQKTWKNDKLRHMGTHIRVLGESYLMNTNMTGLGLVFKNLCLLVF